MNDHKYDIYQQPQSEKLTFTVSAPQRMMLFICITVLCLVAGSIAVWILGLGGASAGRMRIAAVVQDVIMFIIPAIATAVMITRRPADFICARHTPVTAPFILIFVIAICSIPAMNAVVRWNENLTLPSSMQPMMDWMRGMEDAAKAYTELLVGTSGTGRLILSILIVAILAGFSEELFFRGALQRLLSTSGMNHHGAIWLAAVIFSAVHMQFFGFVPRLILGAYFGYLLLWSRSIWLPVAAHALNNALAVVAFRLESNADSAAQISTIGQNPSSMIDFAIIAASVAITAAAIAVIRRYCLSRSARRY